MDGKKRYWALKASANEIKLEENLFWGNAVSSGEKEGDKELEPLV